MDSNFNIRVLKAHFSLFEDFLNQPGLKFNENDSPKNIIGPTGEEVVELKYSSFENGMYKSIFEKGRAWQKEISQKGAKNDQLNNTYSMDSSPYEEVKVTLNLSEKEYNSFTSFIQKFQYAVKSYDLGGHIIRDIYSVHVVFFSPSSLKNPSQTIFYLGEIWQNFLDEGPDE